jgi:GntR family transcriptional regulator
MELDKHSPVPLYYQLAEAIREQVRSGELNPGDQLPPERILSEQAGISRMTARQALAYLVRQGTLVVRHGLGTFVAEPKLTYDAFHLLGFSEEIMHHGGTATSRVIECVLHTPPARVAAMLQLPDGESAVKIVRLRLSGEAPLLLETIYLPAALCPGLEHEDLTGASLYGLLEQRYGVRMQRAEQTLEATIANDFESKLFEIAPGTPMILLEGVTYEERRRPAEYFKAIYRGDRFTFAFASERGVMIPLAGGPREYQMPSADGAARQLPTGAP